MNNSAYEGVNEPEFFNRSVEAQYDEKAPNLSQTLNIAVIGKVSAGKSSLINALLKLSRKQGLKNAKVGGYSGVTKEIKILKLDKLYLVDSPGLDDVRKKNSKRTKKFLRHIDVGIFVVTGSLDYSQKKNFDNLKKHCDSIFVVLNKIDEWDDLDKSVLDEIIEQWKHNLGVSKIYPTCTNGYDPKSYSRKMDIRGVLKLRSDIEEFLEKKGKGLLLATHMAEKKSYAVKIIAAALATVAGEAFIPGGAVYITATQGVAIASLYYLYTGQTLSSQAALLTISTCVTETAHCSLFLFVKSFLPPTGVVDMAAAGVTVVITLALLATVNHIFSTGAELEQGELLRSKFRTYHQRTKDTLKEPGLTDIGNLPSWEAIVLNVCN